MDLDKSMTLPIKEILSIAPKVSIVMPLYNKEAFVEEAVHSVLAQTYPNFELIIVDDGSTDQSLSLVRNILDPRIRVISKENEGVSIARNQGVAQSANQLIAFIDADDKWYQDHLICLVNASLQYPAAGMFCNDYASNPYHEDSYEHHTYVECSDHVCNLLQGGPQVWTSAVMMRRQIFDATEGFPPGESHGEDIAVWISASLIASVVFSNYVGAYYRKTSDGLASKLVTRPDGLMKRIDKILLSNTQPEDIESCLREFRANIALAHVLTAYRYSNKKIAEEFLYQAKNSRIFRKKYLALHALLYTPSWWCRLVTILYAKYNRA